MNWSLLRQNWQTGVHLQKNKTKLKDHLSSAGKKASLGAPATENNTQVKSGIEQQVTRLVALSCNILRTYAKGACCSRYHTIFANKLFVYTAVIIMAAANGLCEEKMKHLNEIHQ